MERKPEEKKGIFTKLKENIDDHDEQMQVLGADQVASIEKAIDDNITLQKTPIHGVGTPWG